MVTITKTEEGFHFEVQGMHKLWSFKSGLTIPQNHILGVRKDPDVIKSWPGWRFPGTSVPFLIQAGTFHKDGNRIFWDVTNPEKIIVIDLKDEEFSTLVIEVENPESAILLLNEK